MAKSETFSEEPASSDVLRWGIAALACAGLAVFSANIAGFMPSAMVNGMHASRIDGTSLNQLRALVADLRQENNAIANQNRALLIRLNLLGDDSGEVVRRLGAVEKSLPLLIESLPLSSDIDRSLLTASIGAAAGEVYDVEGGTMTVRYSPLFDGIGEPFAEQPMPPRIASISHNGEPLGIAVGPLTPQNEIVGVYNGVVATAGPLLLGTLPLIEDTGSEGARVVLGPLPDAGSVRALCERLERLDFACEPTPYAGLPLPL